MLMTFGSNIPAFQTQCVFETQSLTPKNNTNN